MERIFTKRIFEVQEASKLVTLKIDLPMAAIGAPRMTRRDVWQQRPCVVAYRAWKDQVRLRAPKTLPEAATVVRLDWVAEYRPPESWSRKRQMEAIGKPKRTKPDRDNIDKAILDVLFPGCDEKIPAGEISKCYAAEDRLTITIVYSK
jgi:Holliday junction resolvase RusA-like endonuclease